MSTNPTAVATPPIAVDEGTPTGLPRQFLRRPLAVVALGFLLLVIVACAAAPLIAPYAPNETDLTSSLVGPSGSHLLGTDQLGRDTLSRLLYGGRPSLLYAAVVAVVALLVGVPLGLLAGYRGGWVDRATTFITDIGLSIPVLIVVIVVLTVFRDYFMVAMVALGFLLAPPIVRNVRAPVVAIRNELFVDAAKVAGMRPRAIIFRHVLPRVLGPVLVQAALVAAMALLFTVGLAYLGFGPQPPDPTWGSTIAEASQVLGRSIWPLLASGVLVGLVVLCLGLVGDTVRDLTTESWAAAAPRPSGRRRGRARRQAGAASDPATAPPPADPGALLSVHGLSAAFEQKEREVVVVSDVSFTIAPGETVGLVGESGCGKTAVARSIIRLLAGTGRIVAGDLRFEGRDVLAMSGRELASYRGGSVGYVAQEPMTALDPTCRVGSLLAEVAAAHHSLSAADARRRAIELLEMVRLPDAAHVARLYPHELSGGMAQRVAIAVALAGNPSLLIADEPTTALDVTVQAEILDLMRALQREARMAILLVSHDWGVVAELCEKAVVMYAGQVVERGPVEELLERPAHPYTEALLACRPSLATDDGLPLPVITGSVPAPSAWPVGCRFADRCGYCLAACVEGPVAIAGLGDDRQSRCLRSSELLHERAAMGESRA